MRYGEGGIRVSKYTARPIVQLRKDGTFIREIASIYKAKDFGDENGKFCTSPLGRCAKGDRITYRGYIFMYKEDYTKENVKARVKKVRNKYNYKKKEILAITSDGELAKRYESITKASEEYYIAEDCIKKALKDKRYSCVGYKWFFAEEYNQLVKEFGELYISDVLKNMFEKHSRNKKVMRFDSKGNFIKTYDKIKDVEEDGFFSSAVCLVCKGKQSNHRNSIWMYKEDFSKELLLSRVQLYESRNAKNKVEH